MRRDEVLSVVQAHRAELAAMYVKSLALFGSHARDEARADSDVDLLVEFSEPVGLFHFSKLQRHLESLLNCRVDLVTPDALRPRIREHIYSELLRVA